MLIDGVAVRANLGELLEILRAIVGAAPALASRLEAAGFPLEGEYAGPTALGRLLRVDRSQIVRWLSHEQTPSEESARRLVDLAMLLGLPSASDFCTSRIDLQGWVSELRGVERDRFRIGVAGACLEAADRNRNVSPGRDGLQPVFGDRAHVRLFVYNLSRDEHGQKRIQRRAMHLPYDKNNPGHRVCHVWSEDPKTKKLSERIGIARRFNEVIQIAVPEPNRVEDRILLRSVRLGDDRVLFGIASGSFAASATQTIASAPTIAVQPDHFGGDKEITAPGCVYWLDEDWPFFHQVRSIVYLAMTASQEELVFAADRVSGHYGEALFALGETLRRYDRGNPEKIKPEARPVPRKELTEVVPVPFHVSTDADLKQLAGTSWVGYYVIRRNKQPVIRRLLIRVGSSESGYGARATLVYPEHPSDEAETTLLPYGRRLCSMASVVRSSSADRVYYEAWAPDIFTVDFPGYARVAGTGLYLSYLSDDRQDAALAKMVMVRQKWPKRQRENGQAYPFLTIPQDCGFDGFDRIVELLGTRRTSLESADAPLPGEHLGFFSGWPREAEAQRQELEELVTLLKNLDGHLNGGAGEA